MAGEEGEEEEDGEEAGMKEGRAVAVRRGGERKKCFFVEKRAQRTSVFFPVQVPIETKDAPFPRTMIALISPGPIFSSCHQEGPRRVWRGRQQQPRQRGAVRCDASRRHRRRV